MRIFETKDYLNLMEDSYVKNNLCNQNGYPIEIIGVIDAPYPIIAKIKNPNYHDSGKEHEYLLRYNQNGECANTDPGFPCYKDFKQLYIKENNRIKFDHSLIGDPSITIKTRGGYDVKFLDNAGEGDFPLLFKIITSSTHHFLSCYSLEGEWYNCFNDPTMKLVMYKM